MLFAITLTAISCHNDDGNAPDPSTEDIPDSFSEYFGNDVSRNVLGNVIDVNKNPIEGVSISIGNTTAITDSNGVFMVNNASFKERFGYIKAEKAGYFDGSRSLVPTNGTNKVTIMLLEANVVGSVTSGSPETVTVSNGSSVSFDGNFIKEDGSAYSGSVSVMMHHLDPADEDMPQQMPGMLYAQNNEGAERMLQTLGMLAVELRGANGEDLNLAEGSTSEIQIPVDASLMGIAPASIPLWYFDEAKGYWIEEGVATLQGNKYIGTVSHFSFWNCDIPAEAVTLCITATNDDLSVLNNLYVGITSATFGTTYGYTNDLGEVCGFVPRNETLELNIFSYDFCGNSPIYSETIGPFSSDTGLSVAIAENSDIIEETVTGMFYTCDDEAVTDGYVQLTYGNQTFTDIVNDGSFEINLLRCQQDNSFKIKGSDYVNLQTTDSISYTFTTPLTDVGTISACTSITEFIQYTIDGTEDHFIFENINASFFEDSPNYNGPTVTISGSDNSNNGCFYLFGLLNSAPYEGTYNFLDWNGTNPSEPGFNIQECIEMSNTNNSIVYNLTTLGELGEYIDINFSGTYEDYEGNSHSINGVVHVLRDN